MSGAKRHRHKPGYERVRCVRCRREIHGGRGLVGALCKRCRKTIDQAATMAAFGGSGNGQVREADMEGLGNRPLQTSGQDGSAAVGSDAPGRQGPSQQEQA